MKQEIREDFRFKDEILEPCKEMMDEFNEPPLCLHIRRGDFLINSGNHHNLVPDITALGKVIGGGLPVGAYGSRSEIMQKLSPLGPVYQAGTLSGNPLAMAAGIMTLDLLDSDAYDRLEKLGQILQKAVEPILEKHGNPMRLVRMGSLFWFSPGSAEPPARADMIPSDAGKLYSDVHKGLLEKGYMLAPSAYEIGFIATVHNKNHILGMVQALDEVLTAMEL